MGKKTKTQLITLDTKAEDIWTLVDEGKSIREIAAALTERGVETTKTYVHAWLNKDENKDRWKPAMKARGADYAERSVRVLEEVTAENLAQVPLAREQARSYQWMAERLDPEQWGSKGNQVNVQVNLAEAFVQVMRERG